MISLMVESLDTAKDGLVNITAVEDDVMIFSAKAGDETVEGVSNFFG